MIGQQIGTYKITEKLGEGGMGVVYKALDETLDRVVAVKALSQDLSGDPQLVERFRSEAKAQAHLNHTNIATLYTFLVVNGSCYMVMEFVEGESIDGMIRRRGPIPYQEAIPLFKQALLGIGFAHRSGIIHRDIKPANMMVDRRGIVKVMDFGIAKVMGGRRLTRTGTQMGTVYYMSPEQIRGGTLDVRSDIYSLGVMLYEMLTAHLPFEGENDFAVMNDHVNTPPPPPTRFYPYLPPGVEQCVLRALAKDANARFQSVEEFGAALEHPDTYTAPVPGIAATPVPPATVMERPGATPTPYGGATPAYPGTAPQTAGFGSAATQYPAGPTLPPTAAGTTQGVPMAASAASTWSRNKIIGVAGGAVVVVLVVLGGIQMMQSPGRRGGGGGGSSGGGGVAQVGGNSTSPLPKAQESQPVQPNVQGGGAGAALPPGAIDTAESAGGGGTPPGGSAPSAPSGPVQLSAEQYRPTYAPPPVYPAEARRAGITGTVVFQVLVDVDGTIDKVNIVSGPSQLVEAAQNSLRQWRYRPYAVNGHTLKVVTTASVPFTLSAQETELPRLLQSAEAAFQAGRFLDPPDSSALAYARRAKQLDPSNPDVLAAERRIYSAVIARVNALRSAREFASAYTLISQLSGAFPDRPELPGYKQQVQNELAQAQAEAQRQAAQAQVKHFTFMHRHIVSVPNQGFRTFACQGNFSIAPDGTMTYDCTATNDPYGACHHLSFPSGGLKKVRLDADHLHIETPHSGNFDFYGDAASLQAAYAAYMAAQSPGK